jgi:hypothetical protein
MKERQEFQCPVCGFVGLHEPARSLSGGGSYEFCPSCDFEFGVTDDDLGYTDDEWRQKWVAEGRPWRSRSRPQPPGWNPVEQLRSLKGTG